MSLRNKATRRICQAGAAGLTFLLSACSIQPVRLGAVLPLSGPQSSYGASLERGIRLGVEHVNSAGGVGGRRLEVLIRDSGSRPAEAVRQFELLVRREDVPAVIGGGTSDETLAIAPAAEKEHRVLFSPSSSSPAITNAGDWIFRNWPSDEIEGRSMADFAAFTLHASNVLVLSQDCAYAEGIRSVFQSRFASRERSSQGRSIPKKGAESALLDKLRERTGDFQAIYLVGYGGDLLPVIRAIRAARLDIPLLSVSSLADGSLLKQAGEDMDDVLFPRPEYDPQGNDPNVSEFSQAYRSRFGGEPDIYSAHAYDAVGILAEVMESEGGTPDEIREGLRHLHGYPGVTGIVTFDPNGDVVRSFQICVAQRARALPLSQAPPEVLSRIQARIQALRFGR